MITTGIKTKQADGTWWPPDEPTLASVITGDWAAETDSFGVTGAVFRDIIGASFESYKNLTTAAAVAANASARNLVLGDEDAWAAVQRSAVGLGGMMPYLPFGTPLLGCFYAGIIDTTKGNIIASDAFKTGERYAVLLADIALDRPSTQYKTSNDAAPAAARTLWNGLGATAAMNSATYPAAQYCYSLGAPDNIASRYYLPAIDELELVWRNLKPITNNNATNSYTGDFPPYAHASGDNPSSDPAGAPYTAAGAPFQTTVAAFKTGGAQAMANDYYWCATEYNSTYAWHQYFNTSYPGPQNRNSKNSSVRVRPVRRLVL